MPDVKKTRAYYEGNDDKVVLESLQQAGLLPDWEIAKRGKESASGKDGLVSELAPFVRPVNGVGGNAVVLIDLDSLAPPGLFGWFAGQLQHETSGAGLTITQTSSLCERVSLFSISDGHKAGHVVCVAVGLTADVELQTTYGVQRYAIDDYILRIVREAKVHESLDEFKEISHATAMSKLSEVAQLLRKNGIVIDQSKRYLHILRTLSFSGFGIATLIERLLKKAREVLTADTVKGHFAPLLGDLHEAEKLLQKAPASPP